MSELLLHTFLIDTVTSAYEWHVKDCGVAGGFPHSSRDCGEIGKVQMKTYAVVASNAEEAFRRFTEENAGEVVYTGDIVNSVIVGIQLKTGELH